MLSITSKPGHRIRLVDGSGAVSWLILGPTDARGTRIYFSAPPELDIAREALLPPEERFHPGEPLRPHRVDRGWTCGLSRDDLAQLKAAHDALFLGDADGAERRLKILLDRLAGPGGAGIPAAVGPAAPAAPLRARPKAV